MKYEGNNKTEIVSFQESLKLEIFRSGRLRSKILVGLLGLEAISLIVIYLFYSEEYLIMFKNHISIFAILIFTFILIVYETIIQYLISKKSKLFILDPRFFTHFNIISEVTLFSFLLIFIIEYSNQTIILQSPATLTYFIFIVLSIFRLNFRLSLFAGCLAAFEYILISIYYSNFSSSTPVDNIYPGLTGMQYLVQGLIMIITGIAAAFVADLINKKMLVSLNNIKDKNDVIDLFGQQVSSEIVDNILKNKNELLGARKKVCIMFLDIRQFTPFVERHQPEEVVSYLNTLFSLLIDIVQSHHGVINQFLGDGFMATFGAPVLVGNSSQYATEAAQKIIYEINSEVNKGNIPETRIGIGLHYDEAVTGNIGSSARKQYSITGKVVIIASRIEQLNKKYKTQLLISEEVYNQLNNVTKNTFAWLETSKIKGSEKLISLYNFANPKN